MKRISTNHSKFHSPFRRKTSAVPFIIMGLIGIFVIIYVIFIISFATSNSFKQKHKSISSLPIVITTWDFTTATTKAWEKVYTDKSSALDSIEAGCKICEYSQCGGTVGFGGSPDESSETTLDAMIMDGATLNVGAVADLRRIKNAISVARHVLDYTEHSILAGEQATDFAIQMKFQEETLITNNSKTMWKNWRKGSCQPNFWTNVSPDPEENCGPYKPKQILSENINRVKYRFGSENHDTIGMVVIDNKNNIAAGTSTNGAKFKIPGRVGDSPIPGAGAYADSDVGGAAATGDGDVMLRFLPSFVAVEELRRGAKPHDAGTEAIKRISKKYPSFVGGIVVVDKYGEFGVACHGMEYFNFTVSNPRLGRTTLMYSLCFSNEDL